MSTFTSSLKTEWMPDGNHWRVIESFEFHSGEPYSGLFVRVPEGFVTDLASIPVGVRWLIPKAGKNAQAAACHDVLYKTGVMIMRVAAVENQVPVSRAMCDSMMYQAMRALGVKVWRREMIYRGLQVGGWMAWNRLRKNAVRTDTTR